MTRLSKVFHTSLLRLAEDDPLPGQLNQPEPPILIAIDESNEHEEWEVDKILDSRYHYGRCQYKVQWLGHEPDNEWYNSEGFENAPLITLAFHTKYPGKPAPRSIARSAQESENIRTAKDKVHTRRMDRLRRASAQGTSR
jgi:hypothetical protein